MSDQWSDAPLDWVKVRKLGSNPRCPVCKSEPPPSADSYQPGAMFHPVHPFGPCQVPTNSGVCGCRHGVDLIPA